MKFFTKHNNRDLGNRIRYCVFRGNLQAIYLPAGFNFSKTFCLDVFNCSLCIGNCDFCQKDLKNLLKVGCGYSFNENIGHKKGIISLILEEPI